MSEKKSRYQKILERPDRKRPMYVDEVMKRFGGELGRPRPMVLKMKLLSACGGTMEYSWSEKDVDAQTERDRKKHEQDEKRKQSTGA